MQQLNFCCNIPTIGCFLQWVNAVSPGNNHKRLLEETGCPTEVTGLCFLRCPQAAGLFGSGPEWWISHPSADCGPPGNLSVTFNWRVGLRTDMGQGPFHLEGCVFLSFEKKNMNYR